MRSVILSLLLLLLLNCEDKQSQQKNKTSLSDSISSQQSLDQIASDQEESHREPERLTDQNVLYFLERYDKKHKENKVRITTRFGNIDILLFDETKYHRANFIFLTKQGYFNNTQFYRIVNNFVIQGGNSDDIEIAERRTKIGKYLLPPDTKRGYKHERGMVSMPSGEIENAYKLASPYEFFIVQQEGGSHHLDGDYTIFGKVIAGMDVVDKIASQKTDGSQWPLQNIYIQKVEIIK